MDTHSTIQEPEKTVVLLSSPADDAVMTRIRSLSLRYERRLLISRPENWLSIADQLSRLKNSGQLVAVILLLTDDSVDRCLLPEYKQAWEHISNELSAVPTLVFLYEESFQRFYLDEPVFSQPVFSPILERISKSNEERVRAEFSGGLFVQHYLARTDSERWQQIKRADTSINYFPGGGWIDTTEASAEDVLGFLRSILAERIMGARQLIDRLETTGSEIAPYQTRLERIVRTEAFLDALVAGEFLRLYVPAGRFQAEQLASFLRLFEHYARHVEGHEFSVETRSVRHGTIYTFRSDESLSDIEGMDEAINRFQSLLQLYDFDPNQAEKLLISVGLEPDQVRNLLSKYARDFRRLTLDIKHEYETKSMMLRQKFENEGLQLTEAAVGSMSETNQNKQGSLGQLLEEPHFNALSKDTADVPAIEKLINGDVSYTRLDRELLDLFDKFGGQGLKLVQLRSELNQLDDETVSKEMRVKSRESIAAFLYRLMPRLGHSVVMEYIEHINSKPSRSVRPS